MKKHPAFLMVIMLALLIVTTYVAVVVGKIPISFDQVMTKVTTGSEQHVDAVIDLRFPRIFIALFVGAILAVSGALLQAVLQNPLAEANILGVSSGALVVRSLVLLLFPGLYFYAPFLSFIGGVIPFMVLFVLIAKYKLAPVRMILVGVALYAMLNGILELLAQDPFMKIPQGLTMKTWNDVYIVAITAIIGITLALILAQKTNLLAFDEKQANNIGFNITKYRLMIGVVAVFLASGATAIVGQMAFVGLIVPHIVRRCIGSNYKKVLPYSAMMGAWLVLLADIIGRTSHPPLEIPANVLTMMLGGPILIYMICKGAVSHAHRTS